MSNLARIVVNQELADIYGDQYGSLESMKNFLNPIFSKDKFVKTGEEGNLIYDIDDDGYLLDKLKEVNNEIGSVFHDYQKNILYVKPFNSVDERKGDEYIERIYKSWRNKSATRAAAFKTYYSFKDEIFRHIVDNNPRYSLGMSDEQYKAFLKRVTATVGGFFMNVNVIKDEYNGLKLSELNRVREITEL